MDIQRRSDKHGPVRDEIFKKRTEAIETYLDEWRESEPSHGDPTSDLAHARDPAGGAPAGMTSMDVSGRAEIARWLQPGVFPATGRRLVESATRLGAPDQVVRALDSLPRQQAYQNLREVWQELGGRSEDTTHRA